MTASPDYHTRYDPGVAVPKSGWCAPLVASQAVALLRRRGISPERRKRQARLVDLALGPTEPPPEQKHSVDPAARRRHRAALKLWCDDWSSTARALIRKRGHLFRLGLAMRRSPVSPVPEPVEGT